MRPEWDTYYLGIAQAVAARADCTRRQVGAVVVDQFNRILSAGYNGAPPGKPGCLEGACPRGRLDYHKVPAFTDYSDPESPGYCVAIHAEVNALIHAGYSPGATIYITDQPCEGCKKVIQSAGITRVVWPDGKMSF